MMKGGQVEDISDRFLDAISDQSEPGLRASHDAHRQLDATSMQVFLEDVAGHQLVGGLAVAATERGPHRPLPTRRLTSTLMRLAAAARRCSPRHKVGGRG